MSIPEHLKFSFWCLCDAIERELPIRFDLLAALKPETLRDLVGYTGNGDMALTDSGVRAYNELVAECDAGKPDWRYTEPSAEATLDSYAADGRWWW